MINHPRRAMPACGGSRRICLGVERVSEATCRAQTGKVIMSTDTDEDHVQGHREGDLPTRLARGVADGFSEASQAFSNELGGTTRFPELLGRSVAGMIRASARLLDEVATVVRQATDGWGERAGGATDESSDDARPAG